MPRRRMGPADEGLGANDSAGVEIELRLEMQVELLVLDGGTQVAEHGEPSRSPPIDLVSVHLHAEALRLRIEHRDVRIAKRGAVVHVLVDHGETGARGDDDLETVQRDGASDVAYAGPRQFEHLLAVAALADDRKFVAGQTGQDVTGGEKTTHPLAGLDEQLVAGVMPERVVDFLEPVEVEHHDEEHLIDGAIRCDVLERALERDPVRQSRQSIQPSLTLDPLVEHALSQAGGELFGEVLEPYEVVRLETTAGPGSSGNDQQPDHAGRMLASATPSSR